MTKQISYRTEDLKKDENIIFDFYEDLRGKVIFTHPSPDARSWCSPSNYAVDKPYVLIGWAVYVDNVCKHDKGFSHDNGKLLVIVKSGTKYHVASIAETNWWELECKDYGKSPICLKDLRLKPGQSGQVSYISCGFEDLKDLLINASCEAFMTEMVVGCGRGHYERLGQILYGTVLNIDDQPFGVSTDIRAWSLTDVMLTELKQDLLTDARQIDWMLSRFMHHYNAVDTGYFVCSTGYLTMQILANHPDVSEYHRQLVQSWISPIDQSVSTFTIDMPKASEFSNLNGKYHHQDSSSGTDWYYAENKFGTPIYGRLIKQCGWGCESGLSFHNKLIPRFTSGSISLEPAIHEGDIKDDLYHSYSLDPAFLKYLPKLEDFRVSRTESEPAVMA